MGLFDSIQETLGSANAHPELDKTKKALEGLKGKIEAKTIGIEEILPILKTAFMKDLDELGITDEAKRTEYWTQVETIVRTELLKATPEYQALLNMANSPKIIGEGLDKAIKEKKPGSSLKSWLESIPGGAWLTGGLASMLVGWADDAKDKSKNKKDTWLGTQLRKLAGWLGTEETTEAEGEALATWMTEIFQTNTVALDAASVGAEIAALKSANMKEEDIKKTTEAAVGANGILKQLSGVVLQHMGGNEPPFPFHVADIKLESLTPAQKKILMDTIDGKSIDFVLKEKSSKGMRDFLNAALAMKGTDFEGALVAFKKTAPTVLASNAPTPTPLPSNPPAITH